MSVCRKVLITRSILPKGIKLLHENGFEVEINSKNRPLTYEELLVKSSKVDAVITMLSDNIDENFLTLNSHLKVIANYAVGFNNIDLAMAKSKNIIITNTPDVLTNATAEVAMGLMIACARRFNESRKYLLSGSFTGFHPTLFLGTALSGKTLGIIGAGRIGICFAKMAQAAFGMKIIYYSRSSMHLEFEKVTLEELFKQSDVISIHASLNSETKNLINQNSFKMMKEQCILINTARGEIINQNDLVDALKSNQIWAAGLDVTTPEPLPLDHPLMNLDNCFILPHIGSANIETREQMSLLCAQNIIDVFNGIRPIGLI